MKVIPFLFFVVTLLISASVFASNPPANIQTAFRLMYPKATDVSWSQQENYYIAIFNPSDFETKVWFDLKAQWIMTLTDLQNSDQLPAPVYNAFTLGQYSSWEVDNVFSIKFPTCPTMLAIQVGQDNMDTEYLLFYSEDGNLLNTQDITYMDNNIPWTDFFSCQ